jgi:hypothetical protein
MVSTKYFCAMWLQNIQKENDLEIYVEVSKVSANPCNPDIWRG